MAYQLRVKLDVVYVGEGTGSMSVPAQQVLSVTNFAGTNGGFVPVPNITQTSTTTQIAGMSANISTALTTLSGNLYSALTSTSTLSELQGFLTGGG